jgi:hypothetical protein
MFGPESNRFQAPPPHMFNPLADLMNNGPDCVINSKTVDTGSYLAKVVEFLPKTMEARVMLQSQTGFSAQNDTLKVKIAVKRQGEVPGSGESIQLTPGQLVTVQFQGGSTTGLYNHGVITGTIYTNVDQQAPVAPMHMRKDGKGNLYVTHDENGVLASVFYDVYGNKYEIQKGDKIIQTLGGAEYKVTGGASTLRAEDLMRKTAADLKKAAEKLRG